MLRQPKIGLLLFYGIIFPVILYAGLPRCLAAQADSAKFTVEQIRRELRAREGWLRSAELRWTENHTMLRNGEDGEDDAGLFSHSYYRVLAFESDPFRCRYETNNPGNPRAKRSLEIGVQNHEQTRSIIKLPDGARFPFQGSIDTINTQLKVSDIGVMDLLALLPLRWHLHPTDETKMSCILAPGTHTVASERIGDELCAVVEHKVIEGTTVYRFHLAPDRSFAVVRFTETTRGSMTVQCDIKYGTIKGILYPASWRLVMYLPDGRIANQFEVKMDDVKFNEPLADELFDLEFPSNSLILDYRKPEEPFNCSHYLADGKGGLRYVTIEELKRGVMRHD